MDTMPRHVHVVLSDEDYEELKEFKKYRGLTWGGVLKLALRQRKE